MAGLWGEFIFAQPAVDTFIILSGFAISHLLHSRSPSYLQFMIGRFFRIFPVYLVCLGLGFATITQIPFILSTASWRDSAQELAHPMLHLLSHLTLLFGAIPKKFLPEATATLLTPGWSISLEWQYYLVAPLISWLVCSRAGLIALGVVACAGLSSSVHWANPHLAFLPAQLPLFLIGIGSYHLQAIARAAARSTTTSYAIVAVLVAVLMVSWHWVALAIWTLVFGCLFIEKEDCAARSFFFLRRALLHPLTQFLGRISYPLYLVHWPLILVFLAALLFCKMDLASGAMALTMFVVGLPAIILAAWLLHKTVEVPLMRFGKMAQNRIRTTR